MYTLTQALPYIDELLPAVSASLRGATPVQISELEEAAERPLPPPQRELLELMGVDPGPFFVSMAADIRAERLLRYYREVGWRPPERFSLLGLDKSLPHSLFLDAESTPPFAVVAFELPLRDLANRAEPWRHANRFAMSLPELVMRNAFSVFGWVNFELEGYATIEPQPELLGRLDTLLVELGYGRHPLTGGLTGLYGREGVATVTTSQHDADEIALLHVRTDDRSEVQRIVSALQRSMVVQLHSLEDALIQRPYVRELRATFV
ncbi:hypothetical protein DB30_04222 [Enhygromyxa salina]|uniref:Uncharacterized protein n=1 Tax=Enhygromyxa salina TaxID=215803 RepID=A0A0C1ZZI2_9BACT|nr:hypothetical protein [Enhygromyxa salina]KIG16603.1 hypothetical protein DB30_04222 [Enhygromyxa salina]